MKTSRPLLIAIAAGGTGGHMVPAHVLAQELRTRGHDVMLLTDGRGAAIPGLFSGVVSHELDSGHMTGGLMTKLGSIFRIIRNIGRVRRIFQEQAPDILLGFGGYPSLPGLIAARLAGIATVLHEQNAVLGRANRLLSRGADVLALSFEVTEKLPASVAHKTLVTGNPVREEISILARKAYPQTGEDHMLRLLVVGGSLGAKILSDVVPDALSLLPPHLKRRLQVTQQCRAEDVARVKARYQDAAIAAELATYLEDMPDRLRWTHVVIGRSGASTLAELTAAGRPSILVPLPIATDDHQTVNARRLADFGAAWCIPQPEFTPQTLAKHIQKLALEPQRLEEAGRKARDLGRPLAAASLANLVEETAFARRLHDPKRQEEAQTHIHTRHDFHEASP